MNNNKGFTLLELLISVGILVILAGILFPSYISHVHRTRTLVCEENRHTLLDEVDLHLIENSSGDTDEFIAGFMEYFAAYIKETQVCPSKGNIRLRFRNTSSGISVIVSCSKHAKRISRETNID